MAMVFLTPSAMEAHLKQSNKQIFKWLKKVLRNLTTEMVEIKRQLHQFRALTMYTHSYLRVCVEAFET